MLNQCPDCKSELEEGALIDTIYGGSIIQRYAKTDLPKAKQKFMWAFESDMKDIRRVKTLRCKNCNRLFSYAQEFIVNDGYNNKKSFLFIIIITIISLIFIALLPSILSLF